MIRRRLEIRSMWVNRDVGVDGPGLELMDGELLAVTSVCDEYYFTVVMDCI